MLNFLNELIVTTMSILTPIIFYKIITREKVKLKISKYLVFTLIVSCLYILLAMYDTSQIKTIVVFIIQIIALIYVYKVEWKRAIYITFVYSIILMITDMLTLLFISNVLHMSQEYILHHVAGGVTINFVIHSLTIVLTYFLKHFLKNVISVKLEHKIQIIFLSILTFLCIVVFFYNIIDKLQVNENIISNLIMIFIFLGSLIIVTRQALENEKLKTEYDKLLEFMKTYEAEIENQRIANHEGKNQLLTIKAKIVDKEKNQDIIDYIDSLVEEKVEINKEYYAKFQYLPANGLKALFYFKASEADHKGIHVSINVASHIEHSFLQKLSTNNFKQLGRILGVYLDNAIDASYNSREKSLGIEVYTQNENVKIIITNSFFGNIDKRVGSQIYTTKGSNHGHGLMLVKAIINNNPLFEERRQITNNLYIQNLIIHNPTSINK